MARLAFHRLPRSLHPHPHPPAGYPAYFPPLPYPRSILGTRPRGTGPRCTYPYRSRAASHRECKKANRRRRAAFAVLSSTNDICGCRRFAAWCTQLHLRTSGCRTRADCRSSSCLAVPARGRPDGVKQRWHRHRSNSAPSGPAVFAADSGCDLPAASLRCIGNRASCSTSYPSSCACSSPADLHRTRSLSRPCLGMHEARLHSASPIVLSSLF